MSIKKIPFPYYRVKEGETLKTVAEKLEVDATKILLDNCVAPREIKEGVLLKITK